MMESVRDWKRKLKNYKRYGPRMIRRIKRKIEHRGDSNIHRRNALYRTELGTRATEAEIRFGYVLGKLDVKFVFQKGFFNPFHRIFDFYIPLLKLGIEIDGGYHKTIVDKDERKDAIFLRSRGIRTIRLTNEEVLGRTIEEVTRDFLMRV